LKDISENVMERALKASTGGRPYATITYLSALTDYPDSVFDYEKNEMEINKAIRESFKGINVR
jgi:hypothetical protein